MHALETAVLEAFKQDPAKRYTTTELVHLVFKEEYAAINRLINSADKKEQRAGYGRKAKLHRKLLYHVNKLVERAILKEEGVHGKGEKLLALALEEGELVIQERKQRIVIAKPSSVTTQIDGYEQEGLIRKFRPESWLTKQNSVLLDADAFPSLAALQERLQQVLPAVNDVVAIHGFETLVERSPPEALEAFLHYLALDAHDYDVRVALLISLAGDGDGHVLAVAKLLLERGWIKHLTPVFSITPRILNKKEASFTQLLGLFAEHRVKLHLKNSAIFSPPVYFGRAGAYSLTPEEWAYYREDIKGKADGCLVGQIAVAVDLDRFFKERGTPAAFREMLLTTAHAFFEVEERRRRYSADLSMIAPGTGEGAKDFFRAGKHYIRLWNYEWEADYPLAELLGSTQEELDRFCQAQETIFKSCGLPIRFAVGLSTSFGKFDQDFFTERRYRKTVVASLKDLQTKEMTAYLHARERLFKVFKGADRLRFFFARSIPQEEILQVARYLLRAYDLPSFTFDFHGKTGELKLSAFLEEE